ncbi:MAG: sigma-54-dependent Fis family transcriptional regulator [Calditrichaeota bacterium]|nr:sigma-54-dependent Fis family transcriptional regulator [Calditrichota bacterium]
MSERSGSVNILVADDDVSIREGCERVLRGEGYRVRTAADGLEALQALQTEHFDIALLDLKMPGRDGLEVLREIKRQAPATDVVMITGYATVETAVEAMRLGAYDYIPKPFPPSEVRQVVAKVLKKRELLSGPPEQEWKIELDGRTDIIVGDSPRMREVFRLVKKVAPTDSTVLIYGESGTGKELIARAIHYNSHRRDKPFLTVDCGSLVETLFESELFGHVKGAFTGAIETKHGSFELANGGTFLFDEIGNISLSMQAKILRAIQEREIRRVGGTHTIKVDVRVIAATNRDLRRCVQEGTFREDLYYRLSVIPIYLPSLRERKEDIPLLARHFLQKYNQRRKRDIHDISPSAMQLLCNYHWPGNVRELENVIERAVVIEDSDQITPDSLPAHLRVEEKAAPADQFQIRTLEELEKEHITRTLKATDWNRSRAAQLLGIDRKTLYEKIKRYQIKTP